MTANEAIKWLQEAEILDLTFGRNKDREAVDMGIEALENNDKLAEDLQNCLEMYKKKKAEVEALKNQWIPCSERLPEVGEDVFISVGERVCEAHLRASKEYFLIHSGRMLVKTEETDAWMPLPKPYEGDQNEKIPDEH